MKTIEQKAKKVPTIRFAGFDDEWIGYKIADISSSYSGGTPSVGNANYYNGDIPFIRSGEIYESHTELFLSKEGLENSSAKMVEEGDVLYALYGATSGEVCRAKISGAINQALLAIIPKEKWNSDFLVEWFRKEKSAVVDNFLQGGQGNLSAQIIKDLNIKCPSDKEQRKIGSFFSNIDSLISLEQKKYDKLTQVKKSMLEKMFPKEGATVPEIRFAGFTGDWVIQNLNNICSIITKQTGFDYSETIKPSLFTDKIDNTYSFIQNKDFEGLNINLDTDFYIPIKIAEKFPKITLDQPSLLISISGRIGNVGLFSLDTKAFIGGAVGICKLNNVEDGKIALFELQSPTGQLYFKSLIKASSHANITVEDIRQIVVTIPKEECEKKKINQYFSHLDSLISLQQRKLEKLKNIKKSLLEKMFV